MDMFKRRLYALHRNWNRETIFFFRLWSHLVAMFSKMYFDMLHQRLCLISDCRARTLTGVSDLTCRHVNTCVDVDVEDDVRIPPSCLKKKKLYLFLIITQRSSRVSQTCPCPPGTDHDSPPPQASTCSNRKKKNTYTRAHTHTPPSLS